MRLTDTTPYPDPDAVPDNINHPPHYKSAAGLEVIDVIETFELGYVLGNAIKYILRAGKKGVGTYDEDLQKAIWYLNRSIRQKSRERLRPEEASN